MAAPKYEVVQIEKQNPHATMGLKLTVLVVSNTADEIIQENIRYSSKKYPKWLQSHAAHDGVAVMIGGGGSIEDHVDDIRDLVAKGAKVFAMNGAAKWARGQGVNVAYQVIVDAKEETSTLVDPKADEHLFASQCNRKTLKKASNLTLIHFATLDIEDFFPPERVRRGGYVLLGGGSTAGNAGLAAAYSQGFREIHIFGYDSSHRNGKSHGYEQKMNEFMPTSQMTWAGRTFETSLGMKAQAEKFVRNANALKAGGCDLHVYGDGLLQTIYNTKHEDLTEREKYQLMWQLETYREVSPGEFMADFFVDQFKPEGMVIDFGCGTGRASVKMAERGLDVMLIDFADNCRDQEAIMLPFIRHDLTQSLDIRADYGLCTDMMEHIPPQDVDVVIQNIMGAAKNVFFEISTIDDIMGEIITHPLHLTVKPHDWWRDKFAALGFSVEWSDEQDIASLFYIGEKNV